MDGGVGVRLSGALFCAPEQLTEAQRVNELVALERQLASIQARECRVLAAMLNEPCAGSPVPELDKEWVREDVRAALSESAVGASTRLAVALALVHRFPATLTALSRGEVNFQQARLLCEETGVLDPDRAHDVEAVVLAAVRAPGADRTLTAFRRLLRRAVITVDPAAAEQRHQRAVEDRRVAITPDTEGMSTLWGSLPAPDGQLLDTALDFLAEQAAKADPHDARTRAQRRADALVAMARHALTGHCATGDCCGQSPTGDCCGHGDRRPPAATRPAVQVSVALSTLLGLDEQPGELAGHGPIHAELARRIAADENGTWRRLVTDEFGRLLDYGRATYRPPADLDRHVRAHDTECVFPTCHRRSEACELDHTVAWDHGGHTSVNNLKPVCLRHHHAKHDIGWGLRRLPDGTLEWTSPAGHSYTKRSTNYPLDGTPEMINLNDHPAQCEHPATDTDADPPVALPY